MVSPSKPREVKFAVMKLTGQASQYWINVESMRLSRCQEPIEIWSAMKDKLRSKFVPASSLIVFLMIDIDSPKTLSLPRIMWPNLISFSFVVVLSVQKVAPKSFSDLGLVLENYEQTCWLEGLSNLRRSMR